MNTCLRCASQHIARTISPFLFFPIAVTAAVFLSTSAAHAMETLAYSFEDDLQGFSPNGALISLAQDTIGATEGTQSMSVTLDSAATFEGALTSIFDPEVLDDPPGVDYILFDLTVPQAFPVPPAEGFAVVGVAIFGNPQTPPPFGLQAQFADEEAIDGKAAGTYRDIRIDLNMSAGPFGAGKSFNQIFGDSPTELNPSGFELFFNKTGSADEHPLTVYIDNIRIGRITAGVPGDYNGNGTVDAADYVAWRNGGPLLNEVADPGTVSAADYTEWRTRFGNMSGSASSVGAVPEPMSAVLLLVASACLCASRRGTAIR